MKKKLKFLNFLNNIKSIIVFNWVLFIFVGYAYSDIKLPFGLLGTIVESDSTKSIAVIQNVDSKKQGVYKIADKILGYEVIKIKRGKVSLLKDGKVLTLELPLGSEVVPIAIVSSNERIINRNALAKKIPDLNTALTQAIPIPYIESGKIMGLKIAKPKDKALLEMAGLKEGDIATKINGERIGSMQKALELYRKLKNQDKIDLEIKRGIITKTLTYHIN